MNPFGTQVKERRRLWGYSQGKLAVLSGIPQSAMPRIERASNDALTLKTMRKIAGALDCDLQIILAERNSESRSCMGAASGQSDGSNTIEPTAPAVRDWLILTGPRSVIRRIQSEIKRDALGEYVDTPEPPP